MEARGRGEGKNKGLNSTVWMTSDSTFMTSDTVTERTDRHGLRIKLHNTKGPQFESQMYQNNNNDVNDSLSNIV